jgi:hypothetical protein
VGVSIQARRPLSIVTEVELVTLRIAGLVCSALILGRSGYDLEDSWRRSVWYQSKWSLKEKIKFKWKHVPQYLKNVFTGEYDQHVQVELPEPKGRHR